MSEKNEFAEKLIFPMGGENTAYADYFVGKSYLDMLSTQQVVIGNVTFEPGCRNNWHIHHAKKAADRFFLSQLAEVTIRNGAKSPENFIQVMLLTFRRR